MVLLIFPNASQMLKLWVYHPGSGARSGGMFPLNFRVFQRVGWRFSPPVGNLAPDHEVPQFKHMAG